MSPILRSNLALVAILFLSGCQKTTPPAEVAPDAAKTYPIKGEVRAVDPAEGRVTLRHEAIPGFMAAMTMPLRVEDRAALAELHVGDKVEGTLRVDRSRSSLEKITITEAAPPPELTLDLSGGKASLRESIKRLEPGQPVPDFAMIDQDNHPLRLSDLRGKVVALTFIYTRCPLPDFCPLLDHKFADLAQMIATSPERVDRVRIVSVSFDPEHDTPEVLQQHARLKGARPPLWRFAVASHAELAKVAEPLGLMYGPRPREIIHNLVAVIIAPDGTLSRLETGRDWTAADLARTIRKDLASGPSK